MLSLLRRCFYLRLLGIPPNIQQHIIFKPCYERFVRCTIIWFLNWINSLLHEQIFIYLEFNCLNTFCDVPIAAGFQKEFLRTKKTIIRRGAYPCTWYPFCEPHPIRAITILDCLLFNHFRPGDISNAFDKYNLKTNNKSIIQLNLRSCKWKLLSCPYQRLLEFRGHPWMTCYTRGSRKNRMTVDGVQDDWTSNKNKKLSKQINVSLFCWFIVLSSLCDQYHE